MLKRLREVEIPRCVFPDEASVVRRELHTFADASEEACVAACYTRVTYRDGRVLVRLLHTTKLASLKTISVCKLELAAALMGAHLARFVGAALTRTHSACFFWTDSSTVRNWVRALLTVPGIRQSSDWGNLDPH